jgi:hypothetical protein
VDCSAGPGWGGRGGNAGVSGTPGIGGDGSDGSAIYCWVQPSQKPIFDVLLYSNKGGRPGANGRLGTPGKPGRGGPEGQTGGNCGPANRHGANGVVPRPCELPEIRAHAGVSGASPTITPYTGFAELGN